MKYLRLVSLSLVALTVMTVAPSVALAHHDRFSLLEVGSPSASSYSVGDTVSVPFDVSDLQGARRVAFMYRDGIGGTKWMTSEIVDWSQPIADSVTREVEADWNPGNWTLHRVTIEPKDPYVEIDYYRDGSIGLYGGDDHSHGTHTLDFSIADFTVVNEGVDIEAPVLDSFEVLTEGPYRFGDTIRIAYEAHDGGEVGSVVFMFEDRRGREQWVYDDVISFGMPLRGIAEGKVNHHWASGKSTLKYAYVSEYDDDAGRITSFYWPDGTVTSYPAEAIHEVSHSFDLDVSFSVSNSEYDVTPPKLISVERTSDDVIYPGEKATFDYKATDPHFYTAVMSFTGPRSEWINLGGDNAFSSGAIEEDAEHLGPGTYEAQRLTLGDTGYNWVEFLRGGYATTQPDGSFQHDIDFSLFDFEVAPWPSIYEDEDGSGRISVAPAAGKFRIEFGDDSIVKRGLVIQPLVGTTKSFSFTDDEVTLTGVFDEAAGSFRAVVRAFGENRILGS